MTPESLIPTMEVIPVHPFWPEVLLVVTFAAHILFMNAVFGGTVIALVRGLKGQSEISRELSRKLPTLLALTINAGVAPLLFLQTLYGNFDYPASVLMSAYWLALIGVLLLAYYGLYLYDFSYKSLSAGRRRFLLVCVIAMMVYISFMFTNNMTLMLRPEHWPDYFKNPYGTILNLDDPTIIPRYLHFFIAALAIGGLFVALVGSWNKDNSFIEHGMRWFVRGTLVNLVAGIWFLFSIPENIMMKFMGQDILSTLILVVVLIFAALMIHSGMNLRVRMAVISTVITVLLMSVERHFLRNFYLEPYFKIEHLTVSGQWTPMLMFYGFVTIGIVAITYMIRLWLKAERS
ncbi:hypothetical protein [Maridesulfovibrio bastinii]|uniref:hypothetical protein n=1 Tax=Maridesulfovibrio bastinii TaxID=47157 RepID=UPI000413E64C|nr:hypothetical protein [Maridesulfovibrio bastinii]